MSSQRQLSGPSHSPSSGPLFGYQTVRSSKFTFEAEKIRRWVENQLPAGGRVLNACAGLWALNHDGETIRNDIRTDVTLERDRKINGTEYKENDTVSTNTDLNVDVAEISEHIEPNSVDFIIFDPPYSATQSETEYSTGHQTLYHPDIIAEFQTVLRPGGTLMIWSYSPRLYTGFKLNQMMLWNRVGRGHDYVATCLEANHNATLTPVAKTHSASFDPVITGVTGDASFGGNNGKPVDISLHADPDTDTGTQTLRLLGEYTDGLTLIISDVDRDYETIKDRHTGIISLTDADSHDPSKTTLNDHADDWIGVRQLSSVLPENRFDTIVLDLQTDAFSWNTYYEDPDTPWEETTSKTGYDTALKQEALRLTKDEPGSKIIQVGQTATNISGDHPFVRSHVVFTGLVNSDAITSPLLSIDRRLTRDASDSSSPSPDELFYPTRQRTGETKPSELRYSNGVEGTYHRPAYQYTCPECGVAPTNLCLSAAGDPVPVGTVHNDRAAREEEFYDTTVYSLTDHLRGSADTSQRYIHDQFAATDPARPQTRGGENRTPLAVKQSVDDPQLRLASFDD